MYVFIYLGFWLNCYLGHVWNLIPKWVKKKPHHVGKTSTTEKEMLSSVTEE